MQPNALDQDVVNLAKAIRQTESGGNPQAKGGSGEYGAYQFMPETWASSTQKYLGRAVPLEKSSLAEQNEVAYKQIKEWKDQGYNPGQIASMWNAGSGKPDAYLEGNKGVNAQGVAYDTATYAKKVAETYQGIKKGSGQYQTQAQLPAQAQQQIPQEGLTYEPPKETLGGQLSERLSTASTALGKAAAPGAGVGKRASGLLQAAGAGAGAIGDVTSATLRLIPGVEAVEGLIGKGISKAIGTDTGRDLVEGYQAFAQEHPEAAANIGAVANIASVIPLFKGFQLVKDTAKGATTKVLEKSIEKNVAAELTQSATRTKKGRDLLQGAQKRGFNPIELIVKDRLLPDVVQDARGIARYDTQNSVTRLSESLSRDEDVLQNALEAATSTQLPKRLVSSVVGGSDMQFAGYVPLAKLRKDALDTVKREFADRGEVAAASNKVNKIFDDFMASKGDTVTLAELNAMKRGVREAVNFQSPKLTADVRYYLGQTFMKAIEEVAEERGIKGIKEINRQMAQKIQAMDILEMLNNASIAENPGWRAMIGRRGGDMSTIAGEAVGQSFGLPGVGAALGRIASNVAVGGGQGKGLIALNAQQVRKPKLAGTLGLTLPVLQGSMQESRQQRQQQSLR